MRTALQEQPRITIDIPALAQGFIGLFTDDERVVLRFGMLPAQKMGMLRATLEDHVRKHAGILKGDAVVSVEHHGHCWEWSINAAVDEAMHLISCEMYKIGDLVV